MNQELIIALSLGLIGGLIPGPVITAIFTEILQSDFRKILRIILIALITEALVALISLILFSALGLSEAFFHGISLVGAGILIWIAICIPKAILMSDQIHLGAYLFMGVVQMGWLLSTLVVAFIFSRFRKLLSRPKVIPILFKVFAIAFIYFAIDMAYKSIIYFSAWQ